VTDNNRVTVRGRATSYYVEQLALRGILDVIESAGAMRIELNIQVCSPPKAGSTATPVETETGGSNAVLPRREHP
jgi:hypothetical protein